MYEYLDKLRGYLAERGVALIDYGADDRLIDEYYAWGDHLSEQGMAHFTEMLAEDLRPYLDNHAPGSRRQQCE